jgi:hypothetical protein
MPEAGQREQSIMAEATDTAQTALDQLTERLVLLADKIAENAGPAGEAAWNVTMTALRIEAVAYLGIGVVCGALSIAAASLVWNRAAYLMNYSGERDRYDRIPEKIAIPNGLLTAAAGVAGVILGIGCLANVLSVLNWVTAISPEAGMALRIINGL